MLGRYTGDYCSINDTAILISNKLLMTRLQIEIEPISSPRVLPSHLPNLSRIHPTPQPRSDAFPVNNLAQHEAKLGLGGEPCGMAVAVPHAQSTATCVRHRWRSRLRGNGRDSPCNTVLAFHFSDIR